MDHAESPARYWGYVPLSFKVLAQAATHAAYPIEFGPGHAPTKNALPKMAPVSAPRGSPLELAKFKRNRPASAGAAPRRAPSDTRLLRHRPAFGDSQGRATPAPTTADLGRCGYCCLRAREGAGAQHRAGLRRVGTRLLQFAPELDGGQLLGYLCDYARSDAHAHLLNQCLRLDPAGCAGCAPEDAGDALQFARAELEGELMRQTDRLQRESAGARAPPRARSRA